MRFNRYLDTEKFVKFTHSEITCPLCDSYNVNEFKDLVRCGDCKSTWKTEFLGK